MTDEQWLWLYVWMAIDNEDQLDGMCKKCRDEATSKGRCSRCGTDISKTESNVNPNFDMKRFEKLSAESDGGFVNSNFDKARFSELNE